MQQAKKAPARNWSIARNLPKKLAKQKNKASRKPFGETTAKKLARPSKYLASGKLKVLQVSQGLLPSVAVCYGLLPGGSVAWGLLPGESVALRAGWLAG